MTSLDYGYIRHFVACNRHDLSHFIPFFVEGRLLGRIKKNFAELLSHETDLFDSKDGGIALSARFSDFKTRSDALTEATALLVKETGKPLRNEFYPLVQRYDDTPLAQVDRVAVPWFGIRAWGLHVNGFVRKPDGLYLWVGERASDRPVAPGKLDNMIGGGHPIGLTREENLCKEAKEEANVDADLAKSATYIRELSYLLEMPDGLRTDTLFLYDLELPEDFTPQNTDGEVAAFTLMPLTEVADLVRETGKFKFNCNMVITDFLMRHDAIPTKDPEFEGLKEWLAKSL